MRLLIPALQREIIDQQVQFLEADTVENFDQLDELKENCIYVLENLNFRPDEHSYVEPWVEPTAPKKEEVEEQAPEEQSNSKGGKTSASTTKDPKKMTPAERKKFEEE